MGRPRHRSAKRAHRHQSRRGSALHRAERAGSAARPRRNHPGRRGHRRRAIAWHDAGGARTVGHARRPDLAHSRHRAGTNPADRSAGRPAASRVRGLVARRRHPARGGSHAGRSRRGARSLGTHRRRGVDRRAGRDAPAVHGRAHRMARTRAPDATIRCCDGSPACYGRGRLGRAADCDRLAGAGRIVRGAAAVSRDGTCRGGRRVGVCADIDETNDARFGARQQVGAKDADVGDADRAVSNRRGLDCSRLRRSR